MKRLRVIDRYHQELTAEPTAALDAWILSAARKRREPRATNLLAAGIAVALAAVFVVRWMAPGSADSPDINLTHYGIAEGQTRTWLVTFDPDATARAHHTLPNTH